MSQKLTDEEERVIVAIAGQIYANLLGSIDAPQEIGRHEGGRLSGTEIFEWAASESLHRADWFLDEYRQWKARIGRE